MHSYTMLCNLQSTMSKLILKSNVIAPIYKYKLSEEQDFLMNKCLVQRYNFLTYSGKTDSLFSHSNGHEQTH